MPNINDQSKSIRKVLATDLDGTLIPLPDAPENREALLELARACEEGKIQLIYCTGRHFTSVLEAMETFGLPAPEWIICDVGTAIHNREDGGYPEFEAYARHLEELTALSSREGMESLLEGLPGLQLQREEHQRPFKLSYECATEHTENLVERIGGLLRDFRIPYEAHGSIDPFLKCGLIDLLPLGVSKAYALKWLAAYAGYAANQVVYAGDSGNDFSALTSGCRAVVVSNASQGLAERVKTALKEKSKTHALFIATEKATSGVLQGCKHFKWI